MTTNHITIGKLRFGGQDPSNGVSYTITDQAAVVGDVLGADTATPGGAKRTAADTYPLGILVRLEKDGVGTLQGFEKVLAVPLTGAATIGPAGMTCNGDGTVKLVAAGTAKSLLVNCTGTQVKDGVTYAAVHRL